MFDDVQSFVKNCDAQIAVPKRLLLLYLKVIYWQM